MKLFYFLFLFLGIPLFLTIIPAATTATAQSLPSPSPLPIIDFNLDKSNSDAVGIAYDLINDRFAVLDNADNKVYMYAPNGTRLTDDYFTIADLAWSDIAIHNAKYQILTSTLGKTYAYTLDGVRLLGSNHELTFDDPFNNAITFSKKKYFSLPANNPSVSGYTFTPNGGSPAAGADSSFTMPQVRTVPNNIQWVDGYFFISFPDRLQILSYDEFGKFINNRIFIPNFYPVGMTLYNDKLIVVDQGNRQVKQMSAQTHLDVITDLSGSSSSISTILLDWTAPIIIPSPITGYQINFTNPFSDNPQTILTNNTLSSTSSVEISNLNVGVDYSFRVMPYTKFGPEKVSNTADYTPRHTLKIGKLDVLESNTLRTGIKFESTQTGDETLVRAVYNSGWQLQCFYRGTFSTVNATVPIAVSPHSPVHSKAEMSFIDAKNDIITITCRDSLSGKEGKYVLAQKQFLIQEQVADFRSGTYGTFGQIGPIDMFTMTLILFCMIAFNRLNESVGLVISIFIIGISLYLEFISFETAIIPLIAFIIMIVIATTRKQ